MRLLRYSFRVSLRASVIAASAVGSSWGLMPGGAAAATPTQITSGRYHSCSILTDSTVRCWGGNSVGQLGDGSTTDRFTPSEVQGITNATQVALDSGHSCALLRGGTIKCWGLNDWGELGVERLVVVGGMFPDQQNDFRVTPVDVNGVADAIQVTTGVDRTCALLDRKSVV